jgi:glycosyltransferase A (GT-A) superfamily protein (DUF2064 family)
MKGSIAIFAKTVGISPVKTRLAKDIGREGAETFYTLSLDCILELAQNLTLNNNDLDYIIAYGEPDSERYENIPHPCMWTGEGSLGERLHHVHKILLEQYDYAIIIGSDSPQMQDHHILSAIHNLELDSDLCTIGPAIDGGYYLFASSKYIEKEIWTSIPYSQSDTLVQFEEKLNASGYRTSRINVLMDIDVINDLYTLRDTLNGFKNLSVSQKRLCMYLNEVL